MLLYSLAIDYATKFICTFRVLGLSVSATEREMVKHIGEMELYATNG